LPTYQYACTGCGHQLEAVQSFTDDALTVCPACEGRLRKQFGSVGIVFKGSGFYRTDSRANGAKSESGSSDAAKTDGSSSTSKTESTPAKSETKKSEPAKATTSTTSASAS
jgi:putative FmdB family regulatory protein